jgi:hypothetical protein
MHTRPVVATLNGSTVPGLGPDICHDRGHGHWHCLAFPHPSCGVSMCVCQWHMESPVFNVVSG